MNKELREQQMKLLSKEQRQEVKAKLVELKKNSRNLPDSAMTTYFGKPAFYSYGNAHENPI